MHQKLFLLSAVLFVLLSFSLVALVEADSALWNRTYGGTNKDEATSVIETSDGGYAIAGRASSFGDGSYEFWLVKTDAFGNMEWNRTYSGPVYAMAESLVETSDGGYALAGWTYSFGAGSADFWLVKTDQYGIPEYSSWLLPSLLLVATLVIVIYKNKLSVNLRKNERET